MRLLLPLHLALLAVSLPCVAQTHVCIGGDLDHLTATQMSACQTTMTHVRETVRRRGAPADWHFVVVCDEAGWADLAGFTGKATLRNADYTTDGELHWTFLRGSRMADAESEATASMLTAALKGLPGRQAAPSYGAEPMPNPERTVHLPALQVAGNRDTPDTEASMGQ